MAVPAMAAMPGPDSKETNMASESSKEAGEDQVESLIDDLIHEIFNDPGTTAESSGRGVAAAASVFETVFGTGREASRISMLERMLVADAFAAELADALAPALAEQLAPRLLQALEQLMTDETADKKTKPTARSSSQARKPDTK